MTRRPRPPACLEAAALVFALFACNEARPSLVADGPTGTTTSGSSAPAAPSSAPLAGEDAAKAALRVTPAPADADALSFIRTERLRAKAEGRVAVVYVSAAWCEPCKKMKEEIRAGRLDARLARVTLLSFDADRDQERLAGAGYAFSYIPYVALPGADGRPVEQVEAKGKGSGAWREVVGTLEGWQR